MFNTSSRPTAGSPAAVFGWLVAAMVALFVMAAPAMAETAPEPEENPAPAQVNRQLAVCPGQTFAQPFEEMGDNNYYTLVEGSQFNNAGEGWQLYGNARILEGRRPDGSRGGILSLGNGGVAVSPPVCVTLQYPTARTWVEEVYGYGAVSVAVVYGYGYGHYSNSSQYSVGQIASHTGRGWELSQSFNVNPQLGGAEEGVREARFIYSAHGYGDAAFHIYGLYVDPRFGD
jgi:hypothetical protein